MIAKNQKYKVDWHWISFNHSFILTQQFDNDHFQSFVWRTISIKVQVRQGFISLTLEPWFPATRFTGFHILNPGTMGSCYSIYRVSYSWPWNHGFLLLHIQGFIFLTLEPLVPATPYTGFHILTLEPWAPATTFTGFHILNPGTMGSYYSIYRVSYS